MIGSIISCVNRHFVVSYFDFFVEESLDIYNELTRETTGLV
jgi:hypothetical protein